jgi:hypothetical protein
MIGILARWQLSLLQHDLWAKRNRVVYEICAGFFSHHCTTEFICYIIFCDDDDDDDDAFACVCCRHKNRGRDDAY